MLNVFMCLFMVSSTITGATSNNPSRSCTLPMYPTYGTYTVTSDPSAKPGQTMDYFVMTVSCRRGYGFEESGNHTQEVFCAGGVWSQQMPKCVRFCRLNAHLSMRYECRLPGQGLGTCEGFVPPRTTVIATCKPQFFSANEVEYMNCMEYGIWDRIVSCQAECGVVTPQAELQLVGGRFAKFGEFPWHVGIYDKTEQPYGQLCGGSIITSNVVISAAHCFWDDVIKLLPESQFIVATAKLYRKWNDERDVLAQTSEIQKIKIPSLFHGSAASFQQDIAILILKSPFTYLPYVRPVCYDFNSFFEREQLRHGNLGKVSGWGLTAANSGPSPALKVADIPFVSEDVCVKSVPKSFKAYITGDKFCAGYTDGTSAVCKGDSGGGLVFPALERNKERYYLRGIVSASPRNEDKLCNDYTYAAFTKMTAHMKFIIETIAQSTPMACHSYLFQCNDGSCVYPEAECNGIADCKDGSDESYENCTPGAKTTTTTQAPQVCILPPYPEHGRYEVINKLNAKPGFQADSFVVSVSCDSDYGVETDGIVNGTATAEVYCFDGEWITELPACVRRVQKPIAVVEDKSSIGDHDSTTEWQSNIWGLAETNGPNVTKRASDIKCSEYAHGMGNGDLKEFRHVAAIGWASSRNYSFYCGGTLISPRFVLSAGQCTTRLDLRFPEPVIVRLGFLNINDGGEPVNVPIKKIIPHPNYDMPTSHTDNDIALFELLTDVSFQKNIRPACLRSNPDYSGISNVIAPYWSVTDVNNEHSTAKYDDEACSTPEEKAMGICLVRYEDEEPKKETLKVRSLDRDGTGKLADKLREVSLTVVDNQECYLQLDNQYIKNSTEPTHMCATELKQEFTCQGTTGSPLQIAPASLSHQLGIYNVVGIYSICFWKKHGVYTRVAAYIDWIESVVWPEIKK